MAKIIWAGNRFFGPWLKDFGHEIFFAECAVGGWMDWDGLCSAAGVRDPDLVLVSDKSTPPFVLGMESFPCLTAFYAIDSHIQSWIPNYAQGFDLCLVSLKDHLPLFAKRLPEGRVFWFPPFINRRITDHESVSQPGKEWDLLFVGTVNESRNPERLHFMRELKEIFPELHWQGGNYLELFPKARLVLNHSVFHDLNFRVMEALGCGACLLTPKIGHGLEELFRDGQDLFLFDQEDLPGLSALAASLLGNPDLAARAGTCGLEKVNRLHLARNRAEKLSDILNRLLTDGQAAEIVRRRLADQNEIRAWHLKYIYLLLAESMDISTLRKAYLDAATGSIARR